MSIVDIVEEIEKVLTPEEADDADKLAGYQIGKLLRSFKQVVNKKNEEDSEDSRDKLCSSLNLFQHALVKKTWMFNAYQICNAIYLLFFQAFVEFAKSSSVAFASIFNTINLFGATTSYLIHDSNHIKNHPGVRVTFIALSLGFIPFSLVTIGFAHSLPHRKSWINYVACMLMMQIIYMSVMCGLFAYYLIDVHRQDLIVWIAFAVAAAVIIPPWIIYRRPWITNIIKWYKTPPAG